MKILGSFLLSFLIGLASLDVVQIEPTPVPSLVVSPTLKTNKAGRVRFEVKTNCKNIVYLVDEDRCELERVFTDPSQFVYRFAADEPGTFRVVFVAAQGDVPVIAQTVILYEGNPSPVPGPPGPPNPVPPGPTPAVSKLYVVVIEETMSAKANRASYYADTKLLERIKSKHYAFRVEDRDVRNAAGQVPPDLAPYIKAASGKEPYAFLVNEKGKVLWEGPLPTTPADLLALIQKVGG